MLVVQRLKFGKMIGIFKSEYEKFYLHAMVMADSNGNNSLMNTIKNDVEKYDIEAYNYY